MEVRALSQIISDVGEGPLWNPDSGLITWVDITGKSWHQLDTKTGNAKSHDVPAMIGAIVERVGGGYIGAVQEGFAYIQPEGGYHIFNNFLVAGFRHNDAKADANGRWWTGSNSIDFTKGNGKLHRLDSDLTVHTLETGLTLPNGLGWSPDNKYFYLVDSLDYVLWRYNFNLQQGSISEREEIYKFSESSGIPDGLTVDNDGNLLIAMWDGAGIEVLSPDGIFIEKLALPVQKPSSCTFGGSGGNTLIVTSASQGIELTPTSFDGKLLAVTGLKYRGPKSQVFNG
jgi:sugar lactone lactonase YvrE